MIAKVLILLCVAGSASMQTSTPRPGPCPDYDPMDNYDLEQGDGKWYQLYEDTYAFAPLDEYCITKWRIVTSNIDYFSAVSGKLNSNNTERILAVYMYGVQGSPGIFHAQSPIIGNITFTIIDTDYLTYIVYATCHEQAGSHVVKSVVDGKTKVLLPTTLLYIKNELRKRGLPYNLQPINQFCQSGLDFC